MRTVGAVSLLGDSILNVLVRAPSPPQIVPRDPRRGAGKIISPLGVGTFVIQNNGVGLDSGLTDRAAVGGLTVREWPGLRGTPPGLLTFISIRETRPPSPGMASMWIFVSGPV